MCVDWHGRRKQAQALNDTDEHQSWSLTIDAGVQMIAGKDFVKTGPPSLDAVDTSKLDAAERLQLLSAMRVRDDEMNTDVYTYVISNNPPLLSFQTTATPRVL